MDVQLVLKRALAITAVAVMLGVSGVAAAKEPTPDSWDGMPRVKRPGLDAVYVREGASLAKYKKVMLDPVEVSFDKNWDAKRTLTGSNIYGGEGKVDAEAIRVDLGKLARKVTARELGRKNGYPLVDSVGEDVLRVHARIVDLFINAPDTMTPGTRTYVVNAGEMTLVADLYDSQTNTLIGHVIDRERGLERGPYDLQIANRVTNTAEADRILSMWAGRLRKALDSAR
ncbi:MAG: DUF3313 family protein [Gammaproteobacteria bacterium]